jgi:hypothetical protein
MPGLTVIAAAVATAFGAGITLAQPPAIDPNYEPPRTPWGDPDLQGKWPGTAMVGVPMTRDRALGERNRLTEEEFQARVTNAERQSEADLAEFDIETGADTPGGAVGGPVSPPPHWLERGEPQYQASLIVDPADGQYPPTVDGAPAGGGRGGGAPGTAGGGAPGTGRGGGAFGGANADSYLDRSNYDRCITRGIAGSILPVIYNNGNEIFQAPGYVAIQNEMIHEARIIPLDGRPHADSAIRMWIGDSRGHWDGNTLVIETRNLNDQTSIGANGGGGRRIDKDSVLTERLTRIDDDTILYSMTINDPKTWTAPWTFQLPLQREDDYGMFEYACHEGNYAMFNILSGARAEERRAAEAAAAGQ